MKSLVGLVSARAQAAGDEMRHAAPDEAARLLRREGGKPVPRHERIGGGMDVGGAVDQRAIKVEDDAFDGNCA